LLLVGNCHCLTFNLNNNFDLVNIKYQSNAFVEIRLG
jgi:hypothetical protein